MIVLSNYRLTEVYSKSLANDASRLDTLRTRFFELHFDTPIDTRAIGEALSLSSSEIDAILLPPPDPLSSIIPVDDGVALPPPDPLSSIVPVDDGVALPPPPLPSSPSSPSKKRRKGKEPAFEFCASCGEILNHCFC